MSLQNYCENLWLKLLTFIHMYCRLFTWAQQRTRGWTFRATNTSTQTSRASTRVRSCEQLATFDSSQLFLVMNEQNVNKFTPVFLVAQIW